MKEKESIVTTATHNRKGSSLILKNITGNIKIFGQRFIGQKGAKDAIDIEVTGTAIAHDRLKIQASKGKVYIIGGKTAEMLTPPHCDLKVSIPSGVSIRLENVGGAVMINETIETLTVIGNRPCQVFTEALHGAMLHIGTDVDVKIKRLLGHCDVIAGENAQIEVRDALISTLSATVRGNARVDMYGSARFAKLNLERRAYFHIDTVEEFIERQKEKSATLNLGWISSHRQVDEEQRLALIHQASAEMALFVKELLSPDIIPPPLPAAANA